MIIKICENWYVMFEVCEDICCLCVCPLIADHGTNKRAVGRFYLWPVQSGRNSCLELHTQTCFTARMSFHFSSNHFLREEKLQDMQFVAANNFYWQIFKTWSAALEHLSLLIRERVSWGVFCVTWGGSTFPECEFCCFGCQPPLGLCGGGKIIINFQGHTVLRYESICLQGETPQNEVEKWAVKT